MEYNVSKKIDCIQLASNSKHGDLGLVGVSEKASCSPKIAGKNFEFYTKSA